MENTPSNRPENKKSFLKYFTINDKIYKDIYSYFKTFYRTNNN